ncbi:MAG: family 16 glycoside hydrolase [Candidatus Binatia bacterium]
MFLFSASVLALAHAAAQAAVLRLNWQDGSINTAGFKIERLNGSTYVEIASVAAGVLSYSDGNVTAGVNYCYRVRAFNAAGPSAPSSAVCTTALNAPAAAPTNPLPAPDGSSGGSTPPAVPPANGAKDWSDYLISLKIRSADNDALGVMFRYQDKDNYYRFSWFAEGKYRRLEKRVGGVFHVLAEDTAVYITGQSYALQISVSGSSLQVAIDGKPILSANDTAFTRGTMALYSYYNAGSHFDDVRVQDLVTRATSLADDFNDGDLVGWTVIDEGNHNGPSVWSVVDGVLTQTSNIGFTGGDNGQRATYALYTRGNWTDYRLSLKLRSSDNDRLGVMFRVQDSENFYRLSWDQGTPGRKLWKRERGVFKLLAEDAVPYATGQTHGLEIIAQGNSFKVNIDGKPAFFLTDQSFPIGTVALYSSHNQGGVFDDVLVEDLANKSVLLWDDFSDGNLAGWKAFDDPGTTLGPSDWSVVNGTLVQGSNIGSDATGHPGTFLLY